MRPPGSAEGKVYAVDIDREAIDKVRQRKEREKPEQVEPVLGEGADPRLPDDLDAVLIVDETPSPKSIPKGLVTAKLPRQSIRLRA